MYFETSSAAADMHSAAPDKRSAAPDKRSAAVNSRFAAEKGALRQTLNGLKIEIFRTLHLVCKKSIFPQY